MFADKRVLAVITARGGSKGLPRKNLLPLGGLPLVVWSIKAGQAASYVDRLIVSSDDSEIIETCRTAGCEAPFVRPASLAQDTSDIGPALVHALDQLEAAGETFDLLVLLQATSPFRTGDDIDNCIRKCVEAEAPACLTLCTPEKSPYLALRLGPGDTLEPLHPEVFDGDRRRQGLAPAFVPNARGLCGAGRFV